MELITVLRVLRRWWWLIVLLPLVTASALWFGLRSLPPTYEASVKIQLTTPQREDVAAYEGYGYVSLRDEITVARNNFTQVLESEEVRDRTASQLGLNDEDKEYPLEVTPVKDADFLEVVVESRTPGLAAEIANTHADVAIAYYGDLRAKPTYAERDLFAEKLRIAEEGFQGAEKSLAQFQAEHGIVSLEEQLDTYQQLLEQLQLERDRLLLEETTQVVDPVSDIDQLIAQHQQDLDRLAALQPAYNMLEEDVQLAREKYRSAWAQQESAPESAEGQPVDQTSSVLEELRTAEAALANFKSEQGIVSLESELATYQTRLGELELERDRLVLEETSRDVDQVSQVEELIARRQQEMDQLSVLLPTHDLLVEDLEQAREQYAHILDKYTEAELKAAAVKAANFIQVVESARPPTEPSSNAVMLLVLAVAGSVGLGVVLAFLLEYVTSAADDTIPLHEGNGRKVWGLPVLGRVPPMADGRCDPDSPQAEAVRQLRTRLLMSSTGGRSGVLLVTSPQPKDGKTVMAANLGAAMASGSARVVLVDADLRAPALHEWFDQPNLDGLANWLMADDASSDSLLELARDTHIPGLSLITAGRLPKDPSILLASERMRAVLEMLSERFDHVVLDSPPMVGAPDSVILAKLTQSVLLVLSPDRTSRRIARQAVDSLYPWDDLQFIGIALNRTSPSPYGYHYYGRPKTLPQKIGQNLSSLPLMRRQRNAGLISISEAASMLGVRKATVKRWCREGRLPAVKRGLRWWVMQRELEGMTPEQLLDAVRPRPPMTDAIDGSPRREDLQDTTTGPDTVSSAPKSPTAAGAAAEDGEVGSVPPDLPGEELNIPGTAVPAGADRT